jgi:hypothetical protein
LDDKGIHTRWDQCTCTGTGDGGKLRNASCQ